MEKKTTSQKLDEITAQILAHGIKSSKLGSLSGIVGLGAATVLLGPVGLLSGGAGAAMAVYFLKDKIEKENAVKKIESEVHELDEKQLQEFVQQLELIPTAHISQDTVESVSSNIINSIRKVQMDPLRQDIRAGIESVTAVVWDSEEVKKAVNIYVATNKEANNGLLACRKAQCFEESATTGKPEALLKSAGKPEPISKPAGQRDRFME